jgi:probable ATP-dependent RNA helicase DDX4
MGRGGVNILIATPGRLLDFVNRNQISFGNVRFLVLDEADRMLDLGFMPDVQQMVRNPTMPDKEKRQTLMFSATFPREIQEAASEFLNNYLFLTVGIVGGACSDVVQTFFPVRCNVNLPL